MKNSGIFKKGQKAWNKGRKTSVRTKEQKLLYIKNWKINNPDKVKVNQKRNYEKHRESLLIRARKSKLKILYKMTVEDYETLLKNQGYKCAICGFHKDSDKRGYDLAVDHDHKTGNVRQLLCRNCNMVLGQVGDNVELLAEMIKYLNKHNPS